MSKKFEKLLDLVVNEEMDKANELFHEIVVEMSREIYEKMIAEESEEDESVEEASDDMEEESVEEGSYDEMEEETTMEIGGDASDDFIDDTEDHDAMDDEEDDMDDEEDDMGGEEIDGEGDAEERISDLEDALEELKAEFEALMAGEENEPEHSDMFGDEEDDMSNDMSDDMSDEEDEADEGYRMESRRMTREYREKVSDGHGAEKKGKAEEGDGKSGPVSSAKGRPTSDANAKNIAQSGKGVGEMTGERPNAKSGGLAGTPKGEFTKVKGTLQNVNGAETGVKKLSKVGAGHGAEKSGSGETSVNKKPVVGG